MKSVLWVGLVAVLSLPLNITRGQQLAVPAPETGPQKPVTAVAPAKISPAVAEVVRLAESGVGDDVVLAYIQNSQAYFNLGADDVLYLRDVGISSVVITAMLNHDTVLRSQEPPNPNTAPPPFVQETPPPPEPDVPMYASAPPEEVNYFYNDLSPYGTWVDLSGIGWCWQPRVVLINRGWRPYCDGGHWMYSDAGWYWQSEYSWGWAPFHYGRWHLHNRCGWVWAPDTVWGPSWVSWRTSGDYCGWAPLPPHAAFDAGFGWRFNGVRVGLDFDFGLRPEHFTFVGFNDFTRHDLGRRHLAGAEVTRVYSHTTVVNNYTTTRDRMVVNRGIPVERVSNATRTEIHRVAIRDIPASVGRTPRTKGTENGTPVLYRPQLQRSANQSAMVAQRVDDRHPVIQHQTMMPARNQPNRSYASPRSQAAMPPTVPRSELDRRASGAIQSVPRSEMERRTSGPVQTVPRSEMERRSVPSQSAPTQAVPRNYQSTPTSPSARGQPRQDAVQAPR